MLAAQLAQQITEVPAVAERVGSFTAPVRPPAWCNAVLTLVTLAAGTERALRVRYSRLLDGTAA